MRTIRTKLYQFNELSKEAQSKAIGQSYDINVSDEWWENMYEDAANVGLKITGFDIDRASYCNGEFINDADYCAEKIIKEHGKDCETYKTAATYLDNRSKLDFSDDNENLEDELYDLDTDFLNSICEDYRILLTKEYEYITGEEAIKETLIANEMEFTKEGNKF